MPALIRNLQNNWPWASGCAAALIAVGALWTRVDSHAEVLRGRATEQAQIITQLTEIQIEVAKLRTLLEERTRKTP